MAKTTNVLIGVGILAVLLGAHGLAQTKAKPVPQTTAPVRDTAARRPPASVVGDQTAVPRAGAGQDSSPDPAFVPTLGDPGAVVGPNGAHPAVGSWFGKAMEVCAQGVAPSACGHGQPAGILFMTVTITADGLFIGDDSLTLLETPFGPHGTAHGSWVPTSSTEFTADYVFLTKTFPPKGQNTYFSGARAKWQAQAFDSTTLIGWVNAYFLDPTPIKWFPLGFDEYPAIPSESRGFLTSPTVFYKDPGQCLTDGCPRVFKFTLKRVSQ
jgi:hypothetical protein